MTRGNSPTKIERKTYFSNLMSSRCCCRASRSWFFASIIANYRKTSAVIFQYKRGNGLVITQPRHWSMAVFLLLVGSESWLCKTGLWGYVKQGYEAMWWFVQCCLYSETERHSSPENKLYKVEMPQICAWPAPPFSWHKIGLGDKLLTTGHCYTPWKCAARNSPW